MIIEMTKCRIKITNRIENNIVMLLFFILSNMHYHHYHKNFENVVYTKWPKQR